MDDDRIAKLAQRGIISDRAIQRINMMPGLLTPAGPSPGAGVPGRGASIKYSINHANEALDWLARAKFGASDVSIHPHDLAAVRRDIQNYFQYADPTDYVRLAIRQGMQDPQVRRISTAPKQYIGMPSAADIGVGEVKSPPAANDPGQ